MEITNSKILEYCENHTSAESEVLKELNRQTHRDMLQPRMLSGHFQGRFLSMISKMVKPKFILEIGTFTAYSAICLAEGLAEGGKLITIDINAELEDLINTYIEKAGMENKIQYIIGDAYNIVRTFKHKFDLIFIDADKANYVRYYDLVFDMLNEGGYILADNVLWDGKVLDETIISKDKETGTINTFNQKIQNDPRVENLLLPIRDGMMLVRKK